MDKFKDVDMIIHSGDCSNHRSPVLNVHEVINFIEWYQKIPVKYKLFVAGNHDTSIEANLITKQAFTNAGIIYLQNESIVINNIEFWGSPVTPTFGTGWAFNKSRETINRVWDTIPASADVIITHGPPKGVLDLSYDRHNNLEMCGCSALAKKILKVKPKLSLFGHIHRMEGINNAGVLLQDDILYSNGSCVFDGRFDKGLVSHGNILEI